MYLSALGVALAFRELENRQQRDGQGRFLGLIQLVRSLRQWVGRRLIWLGKFLVNPGEKNATFDRKFVKP